MKNKSDSTQNTGGDTKATSNVNTLRKLFESNFKLSHLTNAFKSKNDAVAKDAPKLPDDGRYFGSRDAKENRGAPGDEGCYVDCKIENCCCKTFFRRYDETPNFRPVAKLPLQERNSNSTERWSSASSRCKELHNCGQELPTHHSLRRKEARQNTFYISYDFYKSKAHEIFDETPVSAVSTKRLKPVKAGRSVNLLEKIARSETNVDVPESSNKPFHKTEGFVNFTATTLSEGGYVRSDLDRVYRKAGDIGEPEEKIVQGTGKLYKKQSDVKLNSKSQYTAFRDLVSSQAHKLHPKEDPENKAYQLLLQRLDLGGKSFANALQESEAHRGGAFGFKHRIPKLKNIALREHTYPYSLKKPRLTVKGVKNRHMRNIRRRQGLEERSTLARSQTFNGYDNFAYRCSFTDLQLSQLGVDSCEAELAKVSEDGAERSEDCVASDVCRPRPASISVVGIEEGPQFHLDSRMTTYNWPVTSFYIEREMEPSGGLQRSASFMDVSCKLSRPEKSGNPLARRTNLKRHCSLGYLEDEFFEYNFTRHRRSLENISSKYLVRRYASNAGYLLHFSVNSQRTSRKMLW